MVRILSNGDIVPDNDPRLKQSPSSSTSSTPPTNQQERARPRRGVIQQEGDVHHHMPQTTSIFDTLDARLRQVGVPRWHLGPYAVEPIVSLGFLIALLLLGLKGLILGLLLFFVSKWSQSSARGGSGQGFQGWRGGGLGGFLGGGQGGGGATRGAGGATGPSGGNTDRSSGSANSWSGGGHRLGR